jgi:hypothetical protein
MSEYFNLDTILAEEERIPTTFTTDAFRIGYLDPSDEETVRVLTQEPILFSTAAAP